MSEKFTSLERIENTYSSSILSDPRWERVRSSILSRDDFSCKVCMNAEDPLVIHIKWQIEGELWDAPLGAFLTLCSDCRDEEIKSRESYEQMLIMALREHFLADDVHQLAGAFAINNHNKSYQHIPSVVASALSLSLETPELQKEMVEKYFQWLSEASARRQRRTNDSDDNVIKLTSKSKRDEE